MVLKKLHPSVFRAISAWLYFRTPSLVPIPNPLMPVSVIRTSLGVPQHARFLGETSNNGTPYINPLVFGFASSPKNNDGGKRRWLFASLDTDYEVQ